MECLGRSDQQLKLRGHRVEPGEVEARLEEEPGIAQAVVLAKNDRLIAYIVPAVDSTTVPLDFSLFYFASADPNLSAAPYGLVVDSARWADEVGFRAVWIPERHFHEVGGSYPNPSVLAAALAMVTKRIQLRAGSVVLPLHDVIRVAEEWAVVDNLSNGRAGLAFASGWNPVDFAFRPERWAGRRRDLEDSIAQFRRLWRGEKLMVVDGSGASTEVSSFPRAIQPDAPIWLTAGGTEETFEKAGRLGLNLLTHLLGQSIDELAERIQCYRQAFARHNGGRGLDAGTVTVMVHTFVAASVQESVATCRGPFEEYLRSHLSLEALASQIGVSSFDADELVALAAERYITSSSLIGDIDSCADTVRRLRSVGVDEIACLLDFGVPDSAVLANLEHLAALRQRTAYTRVYDTTALIDRLRALLPDYLVPSAIYVLQQFPTTLNGKVDRVALDKESPQVPADIPRGRSPSAGVEVRMARLWQKVLGLEVRGVNENFFALGGHSLLATQLASRIRREFDVSLPVRKVFEAPTLAKLCAVVSIPATDGAPRSRQMATPGDDGGFAPLSFQQQRLWDLDRCRYPAAVTNKVHAWTVEGDLDIDRLADAATAVVERHEVLRTTFETRNGVLCQVVGEPWRLAITTLPDPTSDDFADSANVEAWLQHEGHFQFDLATGPLVRLSVLKTGPTSNVVVLSRHGITMDGWGVEVFLGDLTSFYREPRSAAASRFGAPALPVTYSDYARGQKRWWADSETQQAHVRYWRASLGNADVPLELVGVLPRAEPPDFTGDIVRCRVTGTTRARLDQVALEHEATLFMALVAAFGVVLGAGSCHGDMVIGTLLANRQQEEVEPVVGFFATTVPMRIRLRPEASFVSLLVDVRHTALAAYDYQEAPIDEVARALGSHTEPGVEAFCPVLFVLQNVPAARTDASSVEWLPVETPVLACRYDICLALSYGGGALEGGIEFASSRYSRATVVGLTAAWLAVLDRIAVDPDSSVGDLTKIAARRLVHE